MGNGATAGAGLRPASNGHVAVSSNGNGHAVGNGHEPAHEADAEGEVAAAAVRRLTRGRVLVLNASYEPLNVTTVRRAHVLVFKGKAEVIEELDQALRSATTTFPWPHVIRLVQYVRVPRTVQRKISRRALFARDDWRCVYCGSSGGRLTLDHVVPKSRGGESVWENVVTSCAPCNLRKGNRLPHEVSMELRRKPRAPAPVLFIRLAAPKIPDGWQPYLTGLSTA